MKMTVSVLHTARDKIHLKILEAIYIAINSFLEDKISSLTQ